MALNDYLHGLDCKVLEKYLEFSDKVGPVLEYGPLKYLGSGYWGEKYARKSLHELHAFEEKIGSGLSQNELSKELKEVYDKLKWNDRKSFFYGVGASAAPTCAAILLASYFGGSDSGLFLLVPSAIILHEYACPSSVRKCKELFLMGEKELSDIVTKMASGNRSVVYLFTKHPELLDYSGFSEEERGELREVFKIVEKYRINDALD